MRCSKCHSSRIIRFLDGFGEWRIFCRTCQESIPLIEFDGIKNMKKLSEFSDYYNIRLP